eukprot:3923700-Alexandrium_andersonii.AAC.1
MRLHHWQGVNGTIPVECDARDLGARITFARRARPGTRGDRVNKAIVAAVRLSSLSCWPQRRVEATRSKVLPTA